MAIKTKTTTKTTGRDSFGLQAGSKRSKAAAIMSKGATMADVKKRVGQTHYNLLKWLERQGHKVTRKDGFITVTPKAQG